MASASNAQYETIDGGCQCSLVRYRITVPRGGKITLNGREYPFASHCTCSTCRRPYSTFTHTSLIVPLSCVQFASRITLPLRDSTGQSLGPEKNPELPPSYAAANGNPRDRRLSAGPSPSSSSSSSQTTVESISSVTSSIPTFTQITESSAPGSHSSPSNSPRPGKPQHRPSFIDVNTPRGCDGDITNVFTASPPSSSSVSKNAQTIPRLFPTPPMPSYYSPLAAEARRNPQAVSRNSVVTIRPPSTIGLDAVVMGTGNVNIIGGGAEKPYVVNPAASATGNPSSANKGKKPSMGIIETINPLAAVTPTPEEMQRRVQQQLKQSNAPLQALMEPPIYSSQSSETQKPQQLGVYLTPSLTIPWPYKEFPISDTLVRGFCEYCGGGLLIRDSASGETGVLQVAAGSLDYPEKILTVKGIFNEEVEGELCGNQALSRKREGILKEWGVALGRSE